MFKAHEERTSGDSTPTPPTDRRPEGAGVCMDVVRVLDFCVIEKRSETLNGAIPLRAAQGCKPFLDGNGAGFHLRLTDPAVIRSKKGEATLVLTDEGYAKADDGYAAKIKRLVERGLLKKDGHWHRELRKGFAWQRDGALFLWTGYLVRPAHGTWLLVSGAFNRRCLVNVDEYVVADADAFVPLVLRLDLSSLRMRETWLDTELACLTPLRPGVRFSVHTLGERPEVGQSWCDFYDAQYLTERGETKYVGRYRKTTARETKVEAGETAECQLIVFGGPRVHQVGTFDRFATGAGRSRRPPAGQLLQFGVLRNIVDVRGRWDGLLVRDLSAEITEAAGRLMEDWAALYGADKVPCINWLADYTLPMLGPMRGEPYLSITPWVFGVTPPGWSSFVDAFDLPGLDGMRGLLSTDTYFGLPPLWQIYKPSTFKVADGTRLARVLPVPRQLLRSTFRESSLDDGV